MIRRSLQCLIPLAVPLGVVLAITGCAPERAAVGPASRTATADGVRPAAAGDGIRINEVESNGGVPGDWVELTNAGPTPFDLSGYVFRDNDDTHRYVVPAGTVVAPGGFVVLDEAQFGFGLGAADAARLFAPDGTTLVDGYAWTAHAATTYGRCPDGTGAFATTTLSTKGAANDCDVAVRINEVESSGGTPGDWVELYNPSAAALDVGGYVFRDNNDAGSGYVIPGGTTIPAGGYLVLDEAQFGFGLGASDAARLYRANGTTLVDSFSWITHAATTYGRCPDGVGGFVTTAAPTKGTANSCAAATTTVRVNEVESNGGSPGDWVELHNTAAAPVDLSGYVFRDNDDTRGYVLPAGTTIAGGGYLVLDEADFGFGLGADDAARLFAPGGVTVVDSYAWTAHAATTYGRCPDGTGPFTTTAASTKGAANSCGVGETPSAAPWPGDAAIATADAGGVFGGNLSGLSYQPLAGLESGVVWAVRNGPGTLFRLTRVNGVWTPRATRTWATGKALRYPNGAGDVDAEGVVAAGTSIYVAAERNNANNGTSRNSILLYDVSAEQGATLTAVREWDLTADLPPNGANLGLEAIARVPDDFLVARGFIDERRGAPYDPAVYPNHEGALFLVGVEATGQVYAYALDHGTGAYTRVASFATGFPAVMELAFDVEVGQLWAVCDNTCEGQSAVLRIDTAAGSPTRGRFVAARRFARPAGMPNLNNEGFTFAPLTACVSGRRTALWADDGETGGFALRSGTLTCDPF